MSLGQSEKSERKVPAGNIGLLNGAQPALAKLSCQSVIAFVTFDEASRVEDGCSGLLVYRLLLGTFVLFGIVEAA